MADSVKELVRAERLAHGRHPSRGVDSHAVVRHVEDRQVEVYTGPESPPAGHARYRTPTVYRPGQNVPLVVAGTVLGSIPVASLFT